MQEDQQEFLVWIRTHEEEMLQDMAELIAIPSVSEGSDAQRERTAAPFGAECRRALERYLFMAQRDGLSCRDLSGYCGEVSVGAEKAERVLGIWNHLDVVPAGEGWESPPYVMTRRGRWILGRGVQDNKGPLVAVYYVLRYLQEKGLLRHIRVKQLAGCDEERGMEDAAWFRQNASMPDMAFVADCGFPVCCGEKGKLTLVLKSGRTISGLRSLQAGEAPNIIPSHAEATLSSGKRIEGKGIGGHAAFPEKTVNAIHMLLERLLQGILQTEQEFESADAAGEAAQPVPEEVFCGEDRALLTFLYRLSADGYGKAIGLDGQDEVSGRLTCNLGMLELREGCLWCQVDIRYPVTFSGDQVLNCLRQADGMERFEIVSVKNTEPYYRDPADPFVCLLQAAYCEETGAEQTPYVMGGGTYAARLPDTVGFGTGFERDFAELGLRPGHGDCHGADEAEYIDNLEKAMCIYRRAILAVDAWQGEECCGIREN